MESTPLNCVANDSDAVLFIHKNHIFSKRAVEDSPFTLTERTNTQNLVT